MGKILAKAARRGSKKPSESSSNYKGTFERSRDNDDHTLSGQGGLSVSTQKRSKLSSAGAEVLARVPSLSSSPRTISSRNMILRKMFQMIPAPPLPFPEIEFVPLIFIRIE